MGLHGSGTSLLHGIRSCSLVLETTIGLGLATSVCLLSVGGFLLLSTSHD
jgi:hypothetical protein